MRVEHRLGSAGPQGQQLVGERASLVPSSGNELSPSPKGKCRVENLRILDDAGNLEGLGGVVEGPAVSPGEG